eukprot:Skav224160  [mRNA]  locus=scaffold2007:139371:149966:+ [translate_table: standard]
MYAHAAVRCANLITRFQRGSAPLSSIPVLCSHLRVCFLQALGQKPCQRFPCARKLLEWIVHVTLSLKEEHCATMAIDCWYQVEQALEQGGEQAMRALMDKRTVHISTSDAVANLLRKLLEHLIQQDKEAFHEVFSKPNEAAVWLKTIATSLEALIVHLPCLSQQKSMQRLDWADDFVTNLGAILPLVTRGKQIQQSLQQFYSLLARGRLRTLEAFRKTTPVTRSEIFEAWKMPLLEQFQSLASQPGASDAKCHDIPAVLEPLFQLSGLQRRRAVAEGLPSMNDSLLRGQSIETLRLQLPPGPISAILALCQIQLHHQVFISAMHRRSEKCPEHTSGWSHCASFGRLVISLATDPDFRKAMDGRQGCNGCSGSCSGTSLALRSINCQLQRSIEGLMPGLMPSELGRLRFLQAQSSALQAVHEKPPEDPAVSLCAAAI